MRTRGTVDDWYEEQATLRDEVAELRRLVLARGLDETLKWRQPAYTQDGKNILLIGTMKGRALVAFFKGALLEDPAGLLVSPGENSRHTRHLEFQTLEEIHQRRADLDAFITQAVAVERSGKRVEPLSPDEIVYVDELKRRMADDEPFRVAFEALTPGRRRAFNIHFSSAKTASAREARIERATERILAGKGPLDCVCGLSKRYPRCDGSHTGRSVSPTSSSS